MNHIERHRLLTTILLIVFSFPLRALKISGVVTDSGTGEVLPFASVFAYPSAKGEATDANGSYSLELSPGVYEIKATYVGYKNYSNQVDLKSSEVINIRLEPNSITLGEVVVSARESIGLETGSKIDRSAMDHLQPSSFTDLLELLPGNISKDPVLTGANTIELRATGNIGATGKLVSNDDYAISSLGTLFVIDGSPLSTDANLQSVGNSSDNTSPHYSRNVTNKGVDMRTISTDNIESVEIVRGIPGAEYGNLTSGVVNIKRINRQTPLTARFKADGYSKLFSVGKGLRFGLNDNILNLDFGYLDSKADPREVRENYRRLTASGRFTSRLMTDVGSFSWMLSADYTGSFDNSKVDPDLSLRKVDEYKNIYRRLFMAGKMDWGAGFGWLDRLSFIFSTSYQADILEQRRQVAPTHITVAPTSLEAGIHDGQYILGEYIADFKCDGRPFNLFGKLTFDGRFTFGIFRANHKLGLEYNYVKNFGSGQIYDLMRPLSAGWTTRPRDYSTIPGLNTLSSFIQEHFSADLGFSGNVDLQAGVRLQSFVGLDPAYKISGMVYLDPRLNLIWNIGSSNHLRPFIGGGFGMTTKMPTVDYLFPQENYSDFVRLNYYDVTNPEANSRISLQTYINKTENYNLRAARNRKWEIRAGVNFGSNSLSVTFFDEKMKSGFRYSTVYSTYSYSRFDESYINSMSLSGPPALDGLPFEEVSVLSGFRRPSNGTRIDKRGVEFQFNSARWKALATAVTITGAWFESTYTNSQKLFTPVSKVIGNTAISDRFVGLYNRSDGRKNSQFNTNFMFDTQLTRFGLLFSTSLQCMWYVKTRQLKKNGVPESYLSAYDGGLHPFTDADTSDPILSNLVEKYNESIFKEVTVPTALYLNFKATKSIGNWLTVSVFVNRLIDYLPDYKVNGLTVRRSTDTYFGMELNIKI